MLQETIAYFEYLQTFRQVEKPKMPICDVGAYTDIEYVNSIKEIMHDFDYVEDFQITLNYLKGE